MEILKWAWISEKQKLEWTMFKCSYNYSLSKIHALVTLHCWDRIPDTCNLRRRDLFWLMFYKFQCMFCRAKPRRARWKDRVEKSSHAIAARENGGAGREVHIIGHSPVTPHPSDQAPPPHSTFSYAAKSSSKSPTWGPWRTSTHKP